MIVGLLRHVGPLVYLLLALYVGTRSLKLSESIEWVLQILFAVVLTYKVIQFSQELISYLLNKWIGRAEVEDPTTAEAVKHIMTIVRVALWVGGAIFVLDNLDVNVTSLLTGIGIGGLAVAIAAQTVLGDAFSSFSIFVDKPFRVGDFIIVGDYLGTVEHVGFKTTRIRSLGGEQLVFANTDLTGSRIRNYKRMETRRVVFKVGVIYQTPVDKVREIPELIKNIIESEELARFDRAHFQSFGDFALVYEIVYYVLTPDYNKYMDVQQSINLKIMEAFAEREIEFAYPTQQLYVTQTQPTT
jgi:small-conductance mechanosensitive channel